LKTFEIPGCHFAISGLFGTTSRDAAIADPHLAIFCPEFTIPARADPKWFAAFGNTLIFI
jgi:hypothetical protein